MKRRNPALIGCAFLVTATVALTGCSRGSEQATAGGSTEATASTAASEGGSTEDAAAGGCPDVVAKAKEAVEKAAAADAQWDGPTEGPKAAEGKTVVYVAQSMQNPGVAGVAEGLKAAAETIGWDLKTIDGQATPAGIQNAFNQALALNPDGIIIGGFDPNTTADQVKQANDKDIPLVGWQAMATPARPTRPSCSAT